MYELQDAKLLSNQIKLDSLEDSIVITSDIDAIEKLTDTQFKNHFDKIIFNEASLGKKLNLQLLEKIIELNRYFGIDLIKYDVDSKKCDNCKIINQGFNCQYFYETKIIKSCIRVKYEEINRFFKNENFFKLNRRLLKEDSQVLSDIITLKIK